MFGFFKKRKNKHCECEVDCGAFVSLYSAQPCKTAVKRTLEHLRAYPWNQIGVNGQKVEIDEAMTRWKLLDKDGNVLNEGNF